MVFHMSLSIQAQLMDLDNLGCMRNTVKFILHAFYSELDWNKKQTCIEFLFERSKKSAWNRLSIQRLNSKELDWFEIMPIITPWFSLSFYEIWSNKWFIWPDWIRVMVFLIIYMVFGQSFFLKQSLVFCFSTFIRLFYHLHWLETYFYSK